MVQVFLKDILCWESELSGLYGHTDGYYATVEQQGRLTLHLHSLIWVKNAASPQEIREKIMGGDSVFQQKLIDYLESAHQGDFVHGPMADVRKRVNADPDASPEEEDLQSGPAYKIPTQTLPTVPPSLCDEIHEHINDICGKCQRLGEWWLRYEHEVDDLLLRSNVHKCRESIQDKEDESVKKDWRRLRKYKPRTRAYHERRGCLSRGGICKARFPREIFNTTHVDDSTGHINIKKTEPQLNTFSRTLTYFSRSNTDVTSLLSGTAVKAVVSYVSDYVSKLGLKTYQAFASVFDVFERNSENLANGAEGVETARTLMRQMINSMSTKMEIGSPMALMYLLGNPDHYCSHQYVNFPWRSYVTFVKGYWYKTKNEDLLDDDEIAEDLLTIRNQNGSYIACSVVDDYGFRPLAYENVNLYEWVQCCEKKLRTRKERCEFEEQLEITRELMHAEIHGGAEEFDGEFEPNDEDSDLSDFIIDDMIIVEKNNARENGSRIVRHPFLPAHKAAFETHTAHCDFRRLDKIIPNFIGGAVPRADKGDREYYCMTIMTLFKPWRTPADLKDNESTWDQIFHEYTFTDRQTDLIHNFNIRYECNDARDDYYAIMRKKMAERGEFKSNAILGEYDKFEDDLEAGEFGDEDMACDDDITIGRKTDAFQRAQKSIRDVLQAAKWLDMPRDGLLDVNTERFFAPYKARRTWAEIVKSERKLFTANKLSDMPPPDTEKNGSYTTNKVELVAHDYFNPTSKLTKEANDTLINDICQRPGFELNPEQERAFRLVAEHA
ncbi:hypothetical protein B0H13DRAFT_2437799, partial [Mycena leptocephala]